MHSDKKGMLHVLLAAILWGSSGVCAQYIMQHSQVSSGWLTMFRLLCSGFILLTLSFMHGDRIFSLFFDRRDLIRMLIFSFFGAMAIQLTFTITIEKSNAATATVLQFLSPTIIVCWFALVRRKRSGKQVIATVITSLAGTFLLVTHGNPTSLSISGSALFWGVLSAFAAAYYTTYPSALIARYGTLPVVGWSMLFGGLMLVPLYVHQAANIAASGGILFGFFYLIIIGTSVAFTLYLKGAQLIGGPKASILSCAEPLSSALLSMLLLGVTFSLPDWLGTLLILCSVVLIALDSHRKRRRHRH